MVVNQNLTAVIYQREDYDDVKRGCLSGQKEAKVKFVDEVEIG